MATRRSRSQWQQLMTVQSGSGLSQKAFKRVIAFQLKELMKEQKLSKTRLAKRMKTSRSGLERLLDPDNPSVTLLTLKRAARALDENIRIEVGNIGEIVR